MFLSTEIRWFFNGNIPESILDWYTSKSFRDNIEFAEPRTDSYLIFPYSIHCGVKLREGNFEVKTRVKNIGNFNGIPFQQWEKWSLQNAGAKDLTDALENDNSKWQDVEKKRMLLYFENKTTIKEVTNPDYDYPVCQFELSEVKMNQQNWWSINLEVSGEGDTLSFLNIASKKLLDNCPINLSAKDAQSYPKWLNLNHNPI